MTNTTNKIIPAGYNVPDSEQNNKSNWPLALKLPAHFFSYLFHPVFISLYIVYFLTYIHPSYAVGLSHPEKLQVIMIVALNAVFFPLFTVLLLKGLGFISSIYLHSQKDRIIPYIASSIFFFWTWHVFRQQSQYHPVFSSFFLGVLLSSSAALIANIYFKVSMHAIGMGGITGLFLIIMLYNTMLMTWPLSLALICTGLVCTSRLILTNHTRADIYIGLSIGILCQIAAALILL